MSGDATAQASSPPKPDHLTLMNEALNALRVVMRVDADTLAETLNRAHSVGPILDPTAYRRAGDSLEQQGVMVRAIKAAQGEVLRCDSLMVLMSAADMCEGRELWPCQLSRVVDR